MQTKKEFVSLCALLYFYLTEFLVLLKNIAFLVGESEYV